MIGAALVLLSASVIGGWLLDVRILTTVLPGKTPMVFNTALNFILLGGVLMSTELPSRTRRWLLLVAVTVVVTLAGLALIQDFFKIDLSYDNLFTVETESHEPRDPMRMAGNTAIAFMLSSTALLLTQFGKSRATSYAVRVIGLAVSSIGAVALAGHVFQIEFLFSWFPSARMAINTATGFMLMGIGLWFYSRSVRLQFAPMANAPRILLTSSAFMIAITLITGVSAFFALGTHTETALKRGLDVSLRHRVEVFRAIIDQGVNNVKIIASRPGIRRELKTLATHPTNVESEKFLQTAVGSFIDLGLSYVSLTDPRGRQLVQIGKPIHEPKLRLSLDLPPHPELLWNGGLVLRVRVVISEQGHVLGTVVGEQPLPLLDRMFQDVRGLGDTGELVVCAGDQKELTCFPSRLHKEIIRVPRILGDQPLPMDYALKGESGITSALDYRRINVIAAYTPIPDLGLGMVMKMDADEHYKPINRQFAVLLTILLFLAVAGLMLQRSQLHPLIRRLVKSEESTRNANVALRNNELRIHAILDNASDGIITSNENGVIESVNIAVTRLFGYSPEEMIGADINMLMSSSWRQEHDQGLEKHLIQQHASESGPQEMEVQGVRKSGEEFPLSLGATGFQLGEKRLHIWIMRDITERKQAEQTIRELSLVDELTGLRNRRGFMTLAEAELLLAQRMKRGLALFYVDMDNMKVINDVHGHATGDDALRAVAEVLRKTFRHSDVIARMGGDEFAVLALESNHQNPELLIERLHTKVLDYNREGGKPYTLSLSAGVVHIDTAKEISIHEWIARADNEMYATKQSHRAKSDR